MIASKDSARVLLDGGAAFPAVFLAGVAGCIGPCSAPRLATMAALSSGERPFRALVSAAVFVAGLAAAYAVIGTIGGVVTRMLQLSPVVYVVLSALLWVAGMVTVVRGHALWHRESAHACGGAAFFCGASSGLLLSPCCTPVLMSVCTYTAGGGSVAKAAMLLSCFALGHGVPVFAAALGGSWIPRFLTHDVTRAASAVSAGLMTAMSLYFAVLA